MKKFLTGFICVTAIIFIAGCGFSKNKERPKVDKLALSYAFNMISNASARYNRAFLRRYRNRPGYDMPKMDELSIESCSEFETSDVKSYNYSIKYDLTKQENNFYANVFRDYSGIRYGDTREIYLHFTIEGDRNGNYRLGNDPVVWRDRSGKSLESVWEYHIETNNWQDYMD